MLAVPSKAYCNSKGALTECGLDVIVEILRRHTKKLERVRRGIGLAFRLNAALEESGLRGNPMLRQVPDREA
jgi:hypothetical protein